MHDQAVHFIPWVAWLILSPIAGIALHFFASSAWSLFGTVVLLLSAVILLTWSVLMTCADRSDWSRLHGAGTVVLGGAWLTLCTVTGFITVDTDKAGNWIGLNAHGFTIGTWAIFGLCTALSWNSRINAKREAEAFAQALASMNPEPSKMDQAGLPGSVWNLRRINKYRSEGVLILGPGLTYDDVEKRLEDLACAFELPPGSVKAYQPKDTENARRVQTLIMHKDPLREPQPWPGLLQLAGAK